MIVANNVLEHVADLPQLMTQALQLLRVGGQLQIEVPYEHAPTAWQDPTHVRAMNENSWIYYSDWFWYLGWFEHRFAVQTSCYLDLELREAPRERAAFMRVTLEKVVTTPRERMTARTMSATLDLPDDALDAAWLYRARPATAQAAVIAPAMVASIRRISALAREDRTSACRSASYTRRGTSGTEDRESHRCSADRRISTVTPIEQRPDSHGVSNDR